MRFRITSRLAGGPGDVHFGRLTMDPVYFLLIPVAAALAAHLAAGMEPKKALSLLDTMAAL